MGKKLKEGISVQELENFGKKHYIEIFFVIYFLLATLFTFLFFGAFWSILLSGIGGIVGTLFPKMVEKGVRASFRFVLEQEKTTKIILATVGIVFSLFLPPLIFFLLGVVGGSGMYILATKGEKQPHDTNNKTKEKELK